jgi:arsenite methyltransferase
MSDGAQVQERADYGYDAGFLMPVAAVACIAVIVFAAVSASRILLLEGVIAFLMVGLGLHTSRRGKFLVWEELLDGLHLRGDEQVLDLGCGRGAVLVAAARRLPKGRSIGVDIWSRADQSGNAAHATRRNAAAANVSERVVPLTANMMQLPFATGTFDLVMSNVAIHNIKGRAGREAAIDEAVRVLRPGGRLLVADLADTRAYAQRLQRLAMEKVGRRSLGWRMWWSGPWRATYLVTATKPEVGVGPAA